MKSGTPNICIGCVSVEDVADAHIRAAEDKDAEGRFILNDTVLSFYEIGQLAKKKFGNRVKVPSRELPKSLVWLIAPLAGLTRRYVARNVGYRFALDNTRSREVLNIDYRSAEDAILGQIEQFLVD